MADMSSEEEAVVDAKSRLKTLDHKVDEARQAADAAPADHALRAQLEMMVAIHDVAQEALGAAERKLAGS